MEQIWPFGDGRELSGRLALIVVDGYVDLDAAGRPGVGAHVYAEFSVRSSAWPRRRSGLRRMPRRSFAGGLADRCMSRRPGCRWPTRRCWSMGPLTSKRDRGVHLDHRQPLSSRRDRVPFPGVRPAEAHWAARPRA